MLSSNNYIVVFEPLESQEWEEGQERPPLGYRLERGALPAGSIPVYLGGAPGTPWEGAFIDGYCYASMEVFEFVRNVYYNEWEANRRRNGFFPGGMEAYLAAIAEY